MLRKKSYYTKDLVSIKNIENGIIETDSGDYIKLIEISPVNFHLRSIAERNQIIYSFASWIKIAPIQLQFKVVSMPTDVQEYVSALNKLLQTETNDYRRKLIRDYIQFICQVGLKESVSRRFFVVLKYTKQGLFNSDYNAVYNSLNTAYTQFKSYIKQCGNSIIEHEDEDVFALEALYNIYNKGSNKTAAERADEIVNYQLNSGIKNPNVSIKDILAPYSTKEFKDYLLINGNRYVTYMYLPSDGYKSSVQAAWFSGLINMGEGIDIDIYFKKEDNSKIISSIGRNIRINRARIKETSDTNTDHDKLSSSIDGGRFIKESMSSGEDFYYMSTIITISADRKSVV